MTDVYLLADRNLSVVFDQSLVIGHAELSVRTVYPNKPKISSFSQCHYSPGECLRFCAYNSTVIGQIASRKGMEDVELIRFGSISRDKFPDVILKSVSGVVGTT